MMLLRANAGGLLAVAVFKSFDCMRQRTKEYFLIVALIAVTALQFGVSAWLIWFR